ncbi:putative folylpolyglutamate synthetase [Haematococcus lacustris]
MSCWHGQLTLRPLPTGLPPWLQRVGLAEDLRKLKVIHVAGTKGKGSTCALVEGVLRRCGYRTGLFTSPHLVDVRERIRIAGQMVSKQVFEEQFWDCHRRLAAAATPEVGVPGYFRFLTLLALRVFVAEQVDVVVLEVGIGGRLDATNVIPHPLVCGVTSLGFDHMEMLGDTLPKIAREKAGIFKPGRPAFTVGQPPDALEALQVRQGGATQAGAEGEGAGTPLGPVAVGLGGDHQRLNAGLAVQLSLAAEQHQLAAGEAARGAAERVALLQQGRLPAVYAQGLAETEWPGRSQVLHDPELLPPPSSDPGLGGARPDAAAAAPHSPGCGAVSRLSLFIDGAHTPESMVTCADWFAAASATSPETPAHTAGSAHPPTPDPAVEVERVLLFNCMKERDPGVLLPALAQRLQARGLTLHHALFVPPNSQAADVVHPQPDLSWQLQLQRVWETQCMGAMAGPAALGGQPVALPELPSVSGKYTSRMVWWCTRRGAVLPSLDATLSWLRSLARSRPQLQVQVLVTGSLYLVGDVLKMMNRAPK